MSDTANTEADTVRTGELLAAATLRVSEAELTALAAGYPLQRAAVDALYAVPEARYVDPALRFRAAGRIEDWA